MNLSRLPVIVLAARCVIMGSALHAQGVSLVNAFPNLTFTQPVLLTHPRRDKSDICRSAKRHYL